MLSIGKLSHLAQLHASTAPHSIDQSVVDAFHDGLDFVSVHETLIDDLKSALASVRSRQSLEMQVDTIVKTKASTLEDRKALQNVSLSSARIFCFLTVNLGLQTICATATPRKSTICRRRGGCSELEG